LETGQCVINPSHLLGMGSFWPWVVLTGAAIFYEFQQLWISRTLLHVTSCSVNIDSLGWDSVSTPNPWISAIWFPNSFLAHMSKNNSWFVFSQNFIILKSMWIISYVIDFLKRVVLLNYNFGGWLIKLPVSKMFLKNVSHMLKNQFVF
jgi:hypothetical protein